jgi:hypothetical protein
VHDPLIGAENAPFRCLATGGGLQYLAVLDTDSELPGECLVQNPRRLIHLIRAIE